MESPLPEHTCKSCGMLFRGFYCNRCGEKVLLPEDRSLPMLLANVLQAVTSADGKVGRTLWLIVTRPGFISREYVAGRRVRYLRPLSLFFALNLIYFLFPVIQLFNASLKTQLRSPLHQLMQNLVAHKMVRENILSIESFSLIYNDKTSGLAKLIVMVYVVLASLPLQFLYRKRDYHFIDHMTFMTEVVCFNLFINAILLTIVLRFTGLGHYADDLLLTVIFACTNIYFLLFGSHRFYGETGWRMALRAMVMIASLEIALEVYRIALFFLTLLTI